MNVSKNKTGFFCSNCGTQSAKWVGKCVACGEWNTLTEEPILKKKSTLVVSNKEQKNQPEILDANAQIQSEERLFMPDSELNRTLGGGLVLGSVVLMGGEPGIGKSTLLLQNILQSSYKTLYVSGEESKNQVAMRAKRIGIRNKECYILPETKIELILKYAVDINPEIIVIDSIQTLETDILDSAPGSVSQVKECTALLIRFAKQNNIPIWIVGHITKDGNIAGPKVLEHMVDTVLLFEGERNFHFRILRAQKNRFGSTNEIGLYEMTNNGLETVTNPSDILLSETTNNLSGVAISASMEGNRPMLLEVQALVSPSVYSSPQRNSTGFDLRRLGMLLAVLEKRGGYRFGDKDVFVNIAGGLKPEDPGMDLAVVAAILSSLEDLPISKTIAFAGEIGLSGEIRPAFRTENRITEAAKMGLSALVMSDFSKTLDHAETISTIKIKKIDDLVLQKIFNFDL
jgi:DNA repair protein RadA/Sms